MNVERNKIIRGHEKPTHKANASFSRQWVGVTDLRGQSAFSRDGSTFATTVQGEFLTREVFIADFDRCTGQLSNPKVIVIPLYPQYNPSDTAAKDQFPTGLAFSPNGKLLYVVTDVNIHQFDLQDNTWFHVAGLDTSWQQSMHYNSSYLGHDDKLYIGNWNGLRRWMNVIHNPDVEGVSCNFCIHCLRVDSLYNYGGLGTPPCMPNYSLGKDSCFAVGVMDYADEDNQLMV